MKIHKCAAARNKLIQTQNNMIEVKKLSPHFLLKNLSSSTGKPKAPTITSVKESNGNFEVMWRTNMGDYFSNSLAANVTYHKKRDTEKVGAMS